MMRLFINGIAASAGGGLTYLRNVVPRLAQQTGIEATVLVTPEVRREFGELPNLSFIEAGSSRGVFGRFAHEQLSLPRLLRRCCSQVLISTGNFALWRSPVPQILLSRNALYTSADFRRDVRARRDYSIWFDTLLKAWFARRSIRVAEITVAPSHAFAQELSRWAGKTVVGVHHGFDRESFARDPTPLPGTIQQQLDNAKDALRLLFVSHYNYYRNFETLFRALPILNDRLGRRPVKLFLTCRLNSDQNPGTYRAESAASLANALPASNVVELGMVPYRALHHLYGACHMYVSPAYAESFAHPLVEAMSSGLPVVASDLEVHREICQDAALYFPSFSPEVLAERVLQVYKSPELARQLAQNGLKRVQDFRWDAHVERLLALARELIDAPTRSA